MRNLQANGDIVLKDFLARAEALSACGLTVLISDYFEYYRLAAYLARYSKKKIAITMGAGSLAELFDEKYYTQLDGGIPRILWRLFKNDSNLHLSAPESQTGELTTVDNLKVSRNLGSCISILLRRDASNNWTTTIRRT